MNRYICIHGHFYQPPRENPWLENVELQESAHPYHDWNKRILAECYAPNTASRILDSDKKIIHIVNNYSRINFNFGPTLLSWMEKEDPDVYAAILVADEESRQRFSGHGSAMAQAYNHMIMPLANARDKRTQVIWGLKDFEYRFKRKPEGMWLPETAVDLETLEILAEHEIKFTVLAPHQAHRIRKIGEKAWQDVSHAKIDPHQPYLCSLPSGKTIALFFYDGPVSQEIAFGDLLKNGEHFAKRLLGTFPEKTEATSLVHIATDGETYGHHHRFGDMALAYCLYHIEANHLAKITVYGEYLAKYPPRYEVQIFENSSWSCAHGIERWKSDCGCCIRGGWQQKWRQPLREALDYLRDVIEPLYEQEMGKMNENPWAVRDKYIELILSRSPGNTERFLTDSGFRSLSPEDKIKALKLLEMQRHAMLMYTSCGWFFDEISGIETAQVIQYAARVIQLAQEVLGIDLEKDFLLKLREAPSNIEEFGNGAVFYERKIKPTVLDLVRVGAHYAVASLFDHYQSQETVYCYSTRSEMYERHESGKQKIAIGRTRIRSEITWEEETVSFAVIHLGDQNLNGGVRAHMDENGFKAMHQEVNAAFFKGNIPEVIFLMSRHFGMNNYSLWHLFKHEQRKIFDQIFTVAVHGIEAHFRRIFEDYYPMMQARRDLNIALPKAIATAIEFVLNRDLIELLEREKIDLESLKKIIEEFREWSAPVDKSLVSFVATQKIDKIMEEFLHSPGNLSHLVSAESILGLLNALSLELNLWKAQNIYFIVCHQFYQKRQKKSGYPEPVNEEWYERFRNLGRLLHVRCE